MTASLAHFQLLRRLRQLLRHQADNSNLVYLWSDQPLANQWLQAELDAHLRTRSLHLQALLPSQLASEAKPPQSLQALLPCVLQTLLATRPQQAKPPQSVYWVAATEASDDWNIWRDTLLARLNESRATLIQNKAFVLLLLPPAYESRAAAIAPDLWSTRSAVYAVPPWSQSVTQAVGAAERAQDFHQATFTPSANLAAQIHRWQTQWHAWHQKPKGNLSPLLAWQLVEQLLELQQLPLAQGIAAQALAVARAIAKRKPNASQSLRDLSISFNKVGDVAQALGQLEQARTSYQESLQISRQLASLTAESPQSLRDLSISFNKVGDVAQRWGNWNKPALLTKKACKIGRAHV